MGVFWTMFVFVAGVLWVMTVLFAIVDIFRSHISGVAKAAWLLFVIIAPFLGVLVYLTAHGDDMARRSMTKAEDRYMRSEDEMADPAPS